MNDFKDHELPNKKSHREVQRDEGNRVIKWVTSVVGSLIVMFTWDLYNTNRNMLEKVTDALHKLDKTQVELNIKIQNIEEKLDTLRRQT